MGSIEKKGIILAFSTAIISGFAVFMNKFAVGFWDSSSVFTTSKNIIAALFLTSVIIFFHKLPELRQLSRKNWFKLILIGFVGGSIPFLLFFKGLALTEATNAAFIHKTLFIWVTLLALPFLKEKFSKIQFLSLGILIAGVYLFAPPSSFKLGLGEFLALSATILWAIENVISKYTLREVSPSLVGWGRMFFGSIFLLAFLGITGQISGVLELSMAKFGWLMLSGFILFGYTTTWYAAIKHISVTVAASILVIAAPITAILNSIFATRVMPVKIILPTFIMIFGVLFISKLVQNIIHYVKRKLPKRAHALQ